jgi:hypothetical protein
MNRKVVLGLSAVVLIGLTVIANRYLGRRVEALSLDPVEAASDLYSERVVAENGFTVEVLVDGRPVPEYAARGRRYVEAFENAEYELRIHNPLGIRVAAALSVDGMNSIDARHTSAWDAHKWVIEPYGTINVRGWQMSSENARRFYFTTERDSYGAKLGQTANLGVISVVFFRERRPISIQPATPAPGEPRPIYKDEDRTRAQSESKSLPESGTAGAANKRTAPSSPPPDDESAATGIGRSVRDDVQWIKMDLEPQPAAEISIRYEYHAALVRLGIIPREYPRPDVLDRRERAKGFEPKFCPQP